MDYRLVAYCIEATQKQDRRENENEGEQTMTGLQPTIMLCHIIFGLVRVSQPPTTSEQLEWNTATKSVCLLRRYFRGAGGAATQTESDGSNFMHQGEVRMHTVSRELQTRTSSFHLRMQSLACSRDDAIQRRKSGLFVFST